MLILAGCFSACKEKEDDTMKEYSTKEGRFDINETEFVRMYFSPESGYIDSPVNLIIENHTKGVLTYGYDFSLEYANGTNWIPIELDEEFLIIELVLLSGETREGEFNFSFIEEYNNGKKGKYRIIKYFSVCYDFPNNSEIDPCFNLYIEFEIK